MGRTVGLLLAATLLAVAGPARSAENAGARSFVADAGVGVGSGGFAWGATLSHQAGRHLYSIRSVQTALFDSLWDVGVLYGRSLRGPRSFAAVSAGVSLVGGYQSAFSLLGPPDEEQHISAVGIPVEAQLFWTPLRHSEIGLGVTLFADINAKRSFGGVLLAVRLGGTR